MPDKTPSEIATALTVASIQSGQITITAENVCDFYEKVFNRICKFNECPCDIVKDLIENGITLSWEK